jgi:hypothetical protein
MKKLGFLITLVAVITGVASSLYMAFTDIGFAIGELQNEPLGNIGGAVIIIELITIAVILIILFVTMLLYRKIILVPILFVLTFGWLYKELSAAGNNVQYFALAIVVGSILYILGSLFKKKKRP